MVDATRPLRRRSREDMPLRVGYVVPEFPGQTHVWIWREIVEMRRWDVPLRVFSTRRPPARDRARHAFAEDAQAETTYLWPLTAWRASASVLWALATRPRGVLRCLRLALELPARLRFRRLRLLGLMVPACELARRCHEQQIEHLHSHSCSSSAILCMMVKRLLGVTFSLTLNANIDWWGGAMLEKFRDAEFTIAITQWLLDQMRREFPSLSPDQALLGRIGVDTAVWVPRPDPSRSDGRTRLITVARLHPTKAHDVLLNAVAILGREGAHLSVRIVGDGPQRGELEAQARRLGLEACVTFMGSLGQEQIIEEMRSSDIFVLVSRFEPLGVAYMEAMAMELPAIGTTAGGVGEIIDDGVDGVLVPPEDPVRLAEAIRTLASDPERRRRLGAAARRKIVTRFDSRVGAATLYGRMMGRAPPASSRCDEPSSSVPA